MGLVAREQSPVRILGAGGHHEVDVQRREHALTLTPDGPPTRVEAYIDGGVVTLTELVRGHSTLSMATNRDEPLPSRHLCQVIDYIEAHLGEELSLLTLAAEADMSAALLSRGFKRATGQSVHQYLLGRRVEWAAALLGGAEHSFAEIAFETGFSSRLTGRPRFQHRYSTTPAAYRREHR